MERIGVSVLDAAVACGINAPGSTRRAVTSHAHRRVRAAGQSAAAPGANARTTSTARTASTGRHRSIRRAGHPREACREHPRPVAKPSAAHTDALRERATAPRTTSPLRRDRTRARAPERGATMSASERSDVALVVGAGDFIGAAIARRFAAGGFTTVVGRRKVDKLAPLVAEIAASGGRAQGMALDARDEANVQAVFDAIERDIGPLAIVVFNVGANVNFPIRDTTSRVFRKVWEMACFGGFLTGREAARVMVPRGRGSIFFTGATASLRGGTGYGAFASAKAGLRILAQSLARELWPQNI